MIRESGVASCSCGRAGRAGRALLLYLITSSPTCTVQTMYVRRRTGASCFFGGGEGGIGGLAFGRYRDSPFGPFLFSFSLHLFLLLLLLPCYEWKAVS